MPGPSQGGQRGDGGKNTIGYRYYMGVHVGICIGPVDAVMEFRGGDRTAWSGFVTTNAAVNVDAPELFGGEKREGGLQGTLDIMMGAADQPANAYLTSVQGSVQPGYRGVLGAVFRGMISANNPYMKPWAFRIRRILAGWDGDAFYPSKAILDFGLGIHAMNPAHIVYQCLTDRRRGKGYSASRLDVGSFEQSADTLYAEGMGLCLAWNRRAKIDEFIQEVCNHAGAAVGEDPQTGLIRMRAIRPDYSVPELQEFSRALGNVMQVEQFDRTGNTGTINELTVQFMEQSTGKQGSVTIHHLGSVQAQKRSIPTTKQYPGCPTAALAMRIAMRDLNVATACLARVRLRCTRDAYGILPGDVIAFSEPERQVGLMPLRVGRVDYGSLERGEIIIEGVQDVFGLPLTTYLQPQPIEWSEPNTQPLAAPEVEMIEVPYRDLVLAIGNSGTAHVDPETTFVAGMAVRPSGVSINYELHTRIGANAFVMKDSGEWCPYGELGSAISKSDVTMTVGNRVDLDQVDAGTAALIGGPNGEHVKVTSVDTSTGVVGIARGCLDTVPNKHEPGTAVWFYENFSASDSTEYATAETVDGSFRTVTGSGILAEADAPTDSISLNQRHFRPYPPGNFRINGEAYPASIEEGAITVTWSHRDRLLQQDLVIDTLQGNIGPEPDTTYTVRYIDMDGETLLEEHTGITGTSDSYTPDPAVDDMRVEVESVRDSVISWQAHQHDFEIDHGPPPDPGDGVPPYEYLFGMNNSGAVKVARRSASPTEGAWTQVASFGSTFAQTTGFPIAACKNEVLVRTQTSSSAGTLQKSVDYGDTWSSDGFFSPAGLMEVGGVGDAGFVLTTLNSVFFRALGSSSWDSVASSVASALGGTYGNSTLGQWTSFRGIPPFRFAGATCFLFGQITSTSPYALGNFRWLATANGTTWTEVARTYPSGSPGTGNITEFIGYSPVTVGAELWIPYRTVSSGSVADTILKLNSSLAPIGVFSADQMELQGITTGSASMLKALIGGGLSLSTSFSSSAGTDLLDDAGNISSSGVNKGPTIAQPYPFGDGAYLGFAQMTTAAAGDIYTSRITGSGIATPVLALSMSGTAARVAYAYNRPFASGS